MSAPEIPLDMEPTQALDIMRQVGAAHHGTLADHQNIQAALATFTKLLTPPPEPEPPAG